MIDVHAYDLALLKVVATMTEDDMQKARDMIDMHYALMLIRCGVKDVFINKHTHKHG